MIPPFAIPVSADVMQTLKWYGDLYRAQTEEMLNMGFPSDGGRAAPTEPTDAPFTDGKRKYTITVFIDPALVEHLFEDMRAAARRWKADLVRIELQLTDTEKAELVKTATREAPDTKPSWQQRVVDEHMELRERLTKLHDFIERRGSAFADLDPEEQHRLVMQQHHMHAYLGILADRIGAWGKS